MGREIDLIMATQKGNISVIKRLLGATRKGVFRNKVSPNFQDARGYTPLHHAIMYGQKEALLMLLRYGADPRISDRSGNYPLHTACQQGDYDSLQLLIEHSPIRPEIDQQNACDDTSLIISAQEGMYALVEFLLRAGADPHISNRLDQNCLELASYYGRTDVVNLLLRKVPRILDTPHSTKHTCLHFAARNGHNSILQLLLDKGMGINTTCKTGSCLHEAALHGKIETIAYLLDRDIDVYLTNALGQTVLEAIQSLAASLCRSRIQQLISDHICHKLKLGNRRSTRCFQNGISSNSDVFQMKDLDNRISFQHSSSFNANPSSKVSSLSNISDLSPADASYSSPYQQPKGLRVAPVPHTSLKQPVHYENEAIMYTKNLRTLPSHEHFDDDVTHAPLSIIRKPNMNLPASLQTDERYYYQSPGAELNSPRTEPHSLPIVYSQQTTPNRGRGSTSSDDYVVRHSYNSCDLVSGTPLLSPDVITSESEFDEISVGSSNHLNHNNFPALCSKRSAPIVQKNPAHSFYTNVLSDDTTEGEQEMYQNFQASFDRTSGFPTDGTYIPLNERSASVLGCSESIDRREFVKNCARHPLANLEESSSRIAIRNGDRVTFYPSHEAESHFCSSTDKQVEQFVPSSSPSASSSVSRSSPINEYSLPREFAVPPIPVRRESQIDPQGSTTKKQSTHRSNNRNLQPLIPEPIIHKPRKKSAPVLHSVPDRNGCAYSQPEQKPQVLRKNSSRGTRRRINTYHEGDYDSVGYPSNQFNLCPINQSGPIPQTGRKYLEKPPAGKPRGSKGYQSENLTSDTSRSTSPSLSETHNKFKYSLEHTPYGDLAQEISPYIHSEYIPSYKVPIRPLSTSGEETPQDPIDSRTDRSVSPEELSMSLKVEKVLLDSKSKDKNRTLTREEPPVEAIDCGWDSIDNVMDMVAQISSEIESSTSTEMPYSLCPSSVPDLMQSIDLPHRAALLMSNGFDDIGFLSGILTQDELEEIGMEDIAEIQHILAAVNLLPAPILNTKPSTVSQWLIQIGLHQLYHLFTSKGYNTMNDVCRLSELQLSTILEIRQLGYRRKINYSLSQIRAATSERVFSPSNPESPLDKTFPMSPLYASHVPAPPPRRDSYAVTQQLWSQYDTTHPYPRDNSRVVSRRSESVPHEAQYSQPNLLSNTIAPPLPPKTPAAEFSNGKRKPKILPKPVLSNNIIMKNSSSFTVSPLRPTERLGHTGERPVAQTKESYSEIGVQLKHTLDLMSDNSKHSLISYLSRSLQPDSPQCHSNDSRDNTATQQTSSKGHAHLRDLKFKINKRSLDNSPLDGPEFITSPIYQQRIEETGENMPAEIGPSRKDRRYHSMMSYSRDSTRYTSGPTDESIASFYGEGMKGRSEQKKNRFGKFRSSKKIVKQNPVYESSGVLQGLPVECQYAARVPSVNTVAKPILTSSVTTPPSFSSVPPSSNEDSPASEIRIRSPLVMRRETMSPNLDNADVTEADSQNIWVHPVNKLTSGSITYTVKFLGSAVVSSLVGKETINNTCKRIKENSKRGKKTPSINLEISWKWIKIYAIEKERLIQEHMMHHISYSSQYMEDLRMFAFISRDKKNQKYYCNVFQSPTIEHADEVVHTLGQAFEISYQHLLSAKKALKTNTPQSNVNKPVNYARSSPLKFHRSQSVDGVL